MKTNKIIALGVAVVLAIGITSTLAYGAISNQTTFTPQRGYGGMMGEYGANGGMVGGGYGSGMMESGWGGGMMRGGMMNGAMGAQCAQYMRNHNYHNWNSSRSGPVVSIIDYAFYPESLTVAKGTTVTWVNMDFVQHTVTSGSEATPTDLFDSHEVGHMQRFSYTFNTPGTYSYYCDLHPGMVGTISVAG